MDMDSQALAHFLCKKWLTGSTNCERTSSHERQAGRAKSRIPSRLHLLNYDRQRSRCQSARVCGFAFEVLLRLFRPDVVAGLTRRTGPHTNPPRFRWRISFPFSRFIRSWKVENDVMDSSFMSHQDLPDPEPLLAHTGWMKSLALSLVHDESLADDLVQETLLTAVERPPRHPEAMPSWLRKVLRNYAYRHREKEAHRRRREMLAALPEETSPTVGEVIERAELQPQMVDLVLKLDEPYRSSFLLSFFEDLSPKEIARRQGVD